MPTTNTRRADVAAALIAWQETGNDCWLESLVATTIAELEHVAAVSLRKHGIHDRSAFDDALALVFDHLRRRLAKRWRQLSDHAVSRLRCLDAHDNSNDDNERRARFDGAIQRLDARLRTVVEMLLAGKSQAAIAHVLDVCEGTVSRMRGRAILELKRLIE